MKTVSFDANLSSPFPDQMNITRIDKRIHFSPRNPHIFVMKASLSIANSSLFTPIGTVLPAFI
jgi:hypothetical protein